MREDFINQQDEEKISFVSRQAEKGVIKKFTCKKQWQEAAAALIMFFRRIL